MFLLAISVTLALATVSTVANLYIQSQFSQDIADRNLNLAHALAGQVDSFIENNLYDMKVLKSRLDLSPSDVWQKVLVDGLEFNPFFLMLQVLGPDKKIVNLAPFRAHLEGLDQSGLLDSLVGDPLKGSVLMSNSLISSQTVSSTIFVALLLNNGTLLAQIRFDSLSHLVGEAFSIQDGLVAVVDRLGVIIAHNNPTKAYENLSLFNIPPVKKALVGEETSWEGEFSGENGLFSASPVPSSGWAVVIFQPSRQAFGIIYSFAFFYFLITIIGTIVTILGLFLFFIYIMAPLKALENQVREVASGQYKVNIPPFYRELEDLGRSFLQMTQGIQAREAEILLTNENLEKRVSDRTEKLERANRELETFNFTVSHDLRSPLRALDGYSLALEEEFGAILGAKGQNYLERIRTNSERMNTLITDLLKLAKISRQEVNRQTVDLGNIIDTLVLEARSRNPERPFTFRRDREMKAYCDPALARIALENLFSNAWKYTGKKDDAFVEMGVKTPGPSPVFYIRDNGAGFDEHHADKLFQPFQRLHSELEFQGTGVGLATVQRILDLHGGWIEGTGKVGLGAEFSFFLGGVSK